MADEKKPNKGAEFFFKHGEKVAVAIAAVALLAYVVMGLAMAKDDPSVSQIGMKEQEFGRERAKVHAENKAPEVQPWVARAVTPWNEVVTAKPGNDSGGTLTPKIAEKVITKPKVPKRGVAMPSVEFGTAEVALDGVTFTWSATGFTMQELTKGKATTEFLQIAFFTVERQVGKGAWEKIAEKLTPPPLPKGAKDIPAIQMKYVDGKIEPKTKYNYRVTAYLDMDALKKFDPAKVDLESIDPTGKLATVGSDQPVATLGIWKLVFSQLQPRKDDQPGWAYVTIEKYDKVNGKVKTAHRQYVGDKIGFWRQKDEDTQEEPKSVHKLNISSKAVDIDFNTGMVLKAIDMKKLKVDVTKCDIKRDATGAIMPHEPAQLKVDIDTVELVYTDDDGKDVKYYPVDPKDHPRVRAAGTACPDHGGKKAAAPEPPKDAPKTDAPKEDPKIAAARAREAEAEKIFAEAEKMEAAKDKSGALVKYESLLKKYADTEFVSKSKKVFIEERIKKLKE
jgi:hypothetical protein